MFYNSGAARMVDGRRTVIMELTISKIRFQGNKWNIDGFESPWGDYYIF